MCEHCDNETYEFAEWEAEPDDFCEWIDDEALETEEDPESLMDCPNPPCFVLTEVYVNEHLCDFHKENNPELDPEANEMAEQLGLGSSELKPIRSKGVTCDYVVSASGDLCGNPARWAVILTLETLLCKTHAELSRQEFEE